MAEYVLGLVLRQRGCLFFDYISVIQREVQKKIPYNFGEVFNGEFSKDRQIKNHQFVLMHARLRC